MSARDGLDARDEGQARVAENNAEWLAHAVTAISELASEQPTLTADDLRYRLEDWGIEEPTHHNAYGVAWKVAAKRGLIRMTDRTRQSVRPQAHAHRHPIWESLLLEQAS